MPSVVDDFTPREVWAEYARRKAALDPSMGAAEYHDAVARIAAELGCGVAPEDLTTAQRLAQKRIVEATRRDWPGIDHALVRLHLRELESEYGARIALAESGSQRWALVEAWAKRMHGELVGVDTEEARRLRALYRSVFEGERP